MRIISQDGIYDIPYEKSVIEREETIISVKVTDGTRYIIAKYSTEEKAIKAMVMCREEYERYLVREGGIYLVTERISQAAFQIQKVFQFPKDEEVEV